MSVAASKSSLKVLVVDDDAANRQIVSLFIAKLGHEVVLAEDGAQAVKKFQRDSFDLVLMDVMMPVMDGYEATRWIKSMCGDRWVPVVFLSALDTDESLVAGLNAGGDDYLSKPINFVVLQAKMRSLQRAIEGTRRLAEARRGLQTYHDHQEAENALAADILARQLKRNGLSDPALASWMATPAAGVSGDVIAATRAPGGVLYVMLADVAGHGLVASISTLPLLTLFYEMARWGMALPAMVARINDQLRQTLPPSRFAAAALLAIDAKKGQAEVWIGGLPPVLLLAADGTVARTFESQRVPLGIVEFDGEMSQVERIAVGPGQQFVLLSDGLVEAADRAGEPFGMAGLESALAAAPPERRLAAVQAAMRMHLREAEPHDDVTLLLVSC